MFSELEPQELKIQWKHLQYKVRWKENELAVVMLHARQS